jgi:hypothetical protein
MNRWNRWQGASPGYPPATVLKWQAVSTISLIALCATVWPTGSGVNFYMNACMTLQRLTPSAPHSLIRAIIPRNRRLESVALSLPSPVHSRHIT